MGLTSKCLFCTFLTLPDAQPHRGLLVSKSSVPLPCCPGDGVTAIDLIGSRQERYPVPPREIPSQCSSIDLRLTFLAPSLRDLRQVLYSRATTQHLKSSFSPLLPTPGAHNQHGAWLTSHRHSLWHLLSTHALPPQWPEGPVNPGVSPHLSFPLPSSCLPAH